jgi:hypothetical protein
MSLKRKPVPVSSCYISSSAPKIQYSQELADAKNKAFWASGAQKGISSYGYRGGGGRKRNPYDLKVHVSILNPSTNKNENLYQIAKGTFDGEVALTSVLKSKLVEWRKGDLARRHSSLNVSLQVEVKTGVTATEKQIAQARKTIAAVGGK